jgi:hypothetical protein
MSENKKYSGDAPVDRKKFAAYAIEYLNGMYYFYKCVYSERRFSDAKHEAVLCDEYPPRKVFPGVFSGRNERNRI